MFGESRSRLASNAVVNHTIFDHHESEKFPDDVKTICVHPDIERIFLEKANSLMPSQEEHQALNVLHEKVKSCLANYVVQNTAFDNATLVSCHDIGSLKMSTLLRGRRSSDLACNFSDPISDGQLDLLVGRLQEDLLTELPDENFVVVRSVERTGVEVDCSGFKVALWPVADGIAGHDGDLHLSKNILHSNKAAMRHVEWFCDNSNENITNLVLILKDLRNKFDGFKPLTPWLLCLLAHYCVSRNIDRTTMSLYSAFRRCLKYLASGFLINSVGIIDPCEPNQTTRTHLSMTVAEQDLVCLTAQYLSNVGSILGYDKVLELQSNSIAGPEDCMITLQEPIQM